MFYIGPRPVSALTYSGENSVVEKAWTGAVCLLGGDQEVAAAAATDLGARYAESHRRGVLRAGCVRVFDCWQNGKHRPRFSHAEGR